MVKCNVWTRNFYPGLLSEPVYQILLNSLKNLQRPNLQTNVIRRIIFFPIARKIEKATSLGLLKILNQWWNAHPGLLTLQINQKVVLATFDGTIQNYTTL